MWALGRILFPTDFSDRSIATARRVKALAERFLADVVVVHVVMPLRPHLAAFDLTSMIPAAADALRDQSRRELANFLETEFAALPVRRILAQGDPAEAIVQHAGALGADLIMMPTRGMGVFRRYVIGSVTAKVLHDADIPVWTGIHHETAPPFSAVIERIVCAVDLGPHSVRVLAWAAGLAAALNARVTLVHVGPDLQPAAGPHFGPGWRSSLESWTGEELRKIEEAAGAQCDLHIETGEAAKGVVRAASALNADLLVIGRSPEQGLIGRLRAHAYAIVGQSPCPVVSV